MKLETFFEKFDQFADAPDAVEKMRELVLHLAVTGKLLPQDRCDEATDELLKRCVAERRKLNRTDSTEVRIVTDEDALGYAIPDSWRWQLLGDILVVGPTNGFSPKAVDYETPVRSLTLSATTSGRFKGEHCKFITTDVPADSDLWLRDGDILVQRGNTIEYVGVAAVYHGEPNCFVYPDLMMKLRVSSSFDAGYVHLAMSHRASRDFLRARASGTSGSMPKINQTTLKCLPVPIPPLAEQKRIVAKVDELMALCDRLEAQQQERETRHAALARASLARFAAAPTPANLNLIFHSSYSIPPAALRKSILTLAVQGKLVPQDPNDEPAEEVFDRLNAQKELRIAAKEMRRSRESQTREGSDDLSEIPQTWKWCRLGEVGNATDSAIVDGPFGQSIDVKSDYVNEGVPVIRMTNVKPFEFIERNLKFIRPEKFASLRRHNVVPGDVLLGKVGSIGLCALYPESMPEGMLSTTGLCRFRVGELVEARFLCVFLNSIADYLRSIASEAVQPFLNMKTINSIAIPVPPLAEQRRIVAKVEQLIALVDALETQLAASRATAANLLSALVAELAS